MRTGFLSRIVLVTALLAVVSVPCARAEAPPRIVDDSVTVLKDILVIPEKGFW
jgi:hypothetical protein